MINLGKDNMMRLRFLIVDDEVHICKLIAKFVGDFYPDCEIAFSHAGMQALAYIEENRPDIVITDIRIPGIDGIELVKRCFEAGYGSKFIIISGYKRFEYAHNALKYGVVNYLLKPIQEEELKEVLKNAEASILSENEHRTNEASMRNELSEYRTQIRGKVLLDLIEGRESAESATLSASSYIMLVVKLAIKSDMRNNDVFRKMVIDQLKHIFSAYFPPCDEAVTELVPYYDFVMLLAGYDEQANVAVEEKAKDMATAITRWAGQYTDFKVSVGISGPFADIGETGEVFHSVRKCTFAYLFHGFGRSFDVRQYGSMKMIGERELSDAEEEFLLFLESGDTHGIRVHLNTQMEKAAARKNLHPYSIYALYLRYIDTLNSYANTLSLSDMWEIKPDGENLLAQNPGEFVHLSVAEILRHVEELEERKKTIEEMPVSLAKQYIKKHLFEDISLDTVAEKVHLSNTYFSMLFRKKTGMTFIDYVIRMKMEEAKRLLSESQMTIGEIAGAVGYQDIHSFTKRFKKEVGIVPSKFRKYHMDSNADWWTQ